MRKLTKRISLAAASAAVAGGAVLGAGGTAAAATPVSDHGQRSVGSVKSDDSRSGRSGDYRHDREDNCRAREHSDRYVDWDRCGRHGHVYQWDDEDCGWKHDRDCRDYRNWNDGNFGNHRDDRDDRADRDDRGPAG
ncbi:hypothetical protein [Streptomyces sp. NPDC001970]